jgi:hypothetical protein
MMAAPGWDEDQLRTLARIATRTGMLDLSSTD